MSRNDTVLACCFSHFVAPREGRVSRNAIRALSYIAPVVAPREGRVSRNVMLQPQFQPVHVAPREGRVSRNSFVKISSTNRVPSRPARGV